MNGLKESRPIIGKLKRRRDALVALPQFGTLLSQRDGGVASTLLPEAEA